MREYSAHVNPKFERIRMTDALVWQILQQGGSLEDVVVALVEQKNKLIANYIELESIAPKRIRTDDGKEWIYHCPDELVPLRG